MSPTLQPSLARRLLAAFATSLLLAACSGAPPGADGGEPDADAGSTSAQDAGAAGSDAGATGSDAGATAADAGSTGADGGALGGLLVATSYVPRLVDLSTGATQEVLKTTLRWLQSPGHLYQHFDASPDGTKLVVNHEYGTNAPASDDRLVLYTLDGSAAPKSLAKQTALGGFPSAPCYRADGKVLVVAQGAIWSLDPALDHTQAPVKVVDITPANQLSSPVYWNRDCSRFVATAFKGGNTNTSATNVGLCDATTGTLTQLTEHAPGQKTLAQQTNYGACSGTGCVTAKSGGTIGAMGWLPDGAVYLKSNRDMWRDASGAFQGEEKYLRYDPAAPKAFADLDVHTGPRPHTVSRDGQSYAVPNGNASTVEVYTAAGTLRVTSAADFNSANQPGFMRFLP